MVVCVPDSCTLIYFTKADLLELLTQLFDGIWVGEKIFYETVIKGRKELKADAVLLERFIGSKKAVKLKKIENDKEFAYEKRFFLGDGETNVFLLSKKKNTVAVTSDFTAYKKLNKRGVNAVRSDELLLIALERNLFSKDVFFEKLLSLKSVGGTTNERITFLAKKALEVKK